MNNETFGITFQYVICRKYELENKITPERICQSTLLEIEKSGIIENLFRNSKPVEFLTISQKYTSEYVRRCPHNFMLANGDTYSITLLIIDIIFFWIPLMSNFNELLFGPPTQYSIFKYFHLGMVALALTMVPLTFYVWNKKMGNIPAKSQFSASLR